MNPRFLLNYLDEQNYIKRLRLEKGSFRQYFHITYKGFERIEELSKKKIKLDQCFVAMSFDPDLKETYESGIRRAIIDAGYKPLRVDEEEYVDKIDDKIISEIRKSGLAVADFTQHKLGVYFEAGFAFGLGIPVIWVCKEDDIKNAHFDTNHYNHIVWNTAEELYEKLLNRINALFPLS